MTAREGGRGREEERGGRERREGGREGEGETGRQRG